MSDSPPPAACLLNRIGDLVTQMDELENDLSDVLTRLPPEPEDQAQETNMEATAVQNGDDKELDKVEASLDAYTAAELEPTSFMEVTEYERQKIILNRKHRQNINEFRLRKIRGIEDRLRLYRAQFKRALRRVQQCEREVGQSLLRADVAYKRVARMHKYCTVCTASIGSCSNCSRRHPTNDRTEGDIPTEEEQ
ncbi:hypothetical protein PQX77_020814 [Marasmius sp. AFHP31]|nr:hypothetical protein PQX77_020814 [Marasmius sp. AFHP31]